MSNMITAKDVEDILEILEQDGWCKKRLMDEHGRKCLYGAFNHVRYGDAFSVNLNSGIAASLDESLFAQALGFLSSTRAVEWNNSDETTFDDIRDRLTETAKKLRDEGK